MQFKRFKRTDPDAPRGCRACNGSGYVAADYEQQDQLTGLLVTIYAQRCCTCPLGLYRDRVRRQRQELAEVR